MDMQWSNSKFNAPFSKIPLFVCSFIMTFGVDQGFAGTSEIPSTLEVKSEEEAFLVRRIAEFWKDRDYILVKRQIHTFLEKFPSSPINDQLRGILGDLYLQDKKYTEALEAYTKINDPAIGEKVLVNRLQCYYELNDFASILKTGKPYISINSKKISERKEELHFLVAESLFRISIESSDISLKQDYANQAKVLYEPLVNSTFGKHSKLALAEIYHTLKQYDKSANLYIELANTYPDQKEELLNQAALSQAEYDPQLAIESFSEVIKIKGKKANDALVNRIILYFQEEEFSEVIKNYQEVLSVVQPDKKTTLDYIVGRSFFAIQDYKNSSEFLSKYTNNTQTASLQLKNALLMQLNNSQQLNNDDLCDQAINQFKSFFSQDKEYGQALYIHAMMCKNRGDFITAEQELAQIIKENKYDDKHSLYLEYGLVTHENAKWTESYTTFKTFIDLYPKSENRGIAYKYFLSSSLNRLKEIDEKNPAYSKAAFYDDVTFVLNEQSSKKNVLSLEEEKDCRLLAAKTAYELKRFAIASKQLDTFIKDYPTDKNLGEAYLILGICYQNTDADPELFYSNIEKAIGYNPELANQASLHLQLYNAYLNKIDSLTSPTANKNAIQSQKNGLYDIAGEHLYKALSLGDTSVKLENKLWLANHYYQKVKIDPANGENLKRSSEIYKSILVTSGDASLVNMSKDSIYLEAEVLKYAELLNIKGLQETKIAVLSNLAEQQTKNFQLGWKFQMQTLLELAQTYEVMRDDENALETYSFIMKNSKGAPSYISDYAILHATRLRFDMMDPEFKNERNEQILTMLNQLKDLQIKKSPSSEPLHLEAALAYAKIRSDIVSPEEKDDKYLFFLNRIKEDYTSSDDPILKEYHKRLATSDKLPTYQAYMTYIDAEMLRTKGKLEFKKNRLSQAEEYNSAALTKLAEIKSNDKITAYLNESVQISIQLIDQLHNF